MALSLADEELPQVKVHATAVISMLNHFVRRDNRDSRVIGTLLGVANGRVLEVTDCYAVPFQESKGSEKLYVGIDEEFHKSMFSFSKRVNKKEQVLGWYASTTPSGALIIDQSSLINDFYTRKSEFGVTNPIHLVVDTTLTGDDVKVRGFVSRPVKVGNANLANCFLELDVEVMMSDAETTALYHMIHGQAEGTVFKTSGPFLLLLLLLFLLLLRLLLLRPLFSSALPLSNPNPTPHSPPRRKQTYSLARTQKLSLGSLPRRSDWSPPFINSSAPPRTCKSTAPCSRPARSRPLLAWAWPCPTPSTVCPPCSPRSYAALSTIALPICSWCRTCRRSLRRSYT